MEFALVLTTADSGNPARPGACETVRDISERDGAPPFSRHWSILFARSQERRHASSSPKPGNEKRAKLERFLAEHLVRTMSSKHECKMLRVSDVARRLSVSERSVFRWIKTGRLRAHHFGKALRISEKSLKEFLDASVD